MVRPPAPSRRGDVIDDRYELVELIGRGGQSMVFRAKDLKDGDEVAIKVIKGAFANDPDNRERMFREAQAMATLQGTAAVRVLDQRWTKGGLLCLVTELLRGYDLDAHLATFEYHQQLVSPTEVVRVLDPIIDTLEVAHSHGIVHRDLKPANIYVTDTNQGGGTRLLDFGYAKFTRARSFTAQGTVAGSPSYIAPEAWDGNPEELDHLIDVYGMGAVIFRCLAGQPPFVAERIADLMVAATTAPRPSLRELRPDLPPQVDPWAVTALSIQPRERFQSIRAMWRAFQIATGVPPKPAARG
jgi:serine/threonine protein kinase